MANQIPKVLTKFKRSHALITWLHAWQIRRKARKDIKTVKKYLKS